MWQKEKKKNQQQKYRKSGCLLPLVFLLPSRMYHLLQPRAHHSATFRKVKIIIHFSRAVASALLAWLTAKYAWMKTTRCPILRYKTLFLFTLQVLSSMRELYCCLCTLKFTELYRCIHIVCSLACEKKWKEEKNIRFLDYSCNAILNDNNFRRSVDSCVEVWKFRASYNLAWTILSFRTIAISAIFRNLDWKRFFEPFQYSVFNGEYTSQFFFHSFSCCN